MRIFCQVVESGSFTAAATALRLPRTTATTEVQALELHVGVRLLQRTTRRVALTIEGAAYFEVARRLLRELADVEASLVHATSSARGRIRFDAPAASARQIIAPALPTFLARHPEIVVELGSSDRPVNLVDEGVDGVVRGGDVHDETLIGRRLADLPVITCAAPAYLARRGTPRSPDELDGHVFVNFFSSKTGRVFEVDWTSVADPASPAIVRTMPHVVAANDADTWIALAVAGMGILQVPLAPDVRARLGRGELTRILTGFRSEPLPSSVLYPAARHLPARVRLFIDFLVELYEAEADAAREYLARPESAAP